MSAKGPNLRPLILLLFCISILATACKGGGSGGGAASVAIPATTSGPEAPVPNTTEDQSLAENPESQAAVEEPALPSRTELFGTSSNVDLDDDPTTPAPISYTFTNKFTPEHNMQVMGHFSVSSVVRDTQMRLEIKGKTAKGSNFRYFFRIRTGTVEIYFAGPSGGFYKRLPGSIVAGKNYPFEILFYDNGVRLSMQLENDLHMTPKHYMFEDLVAGEKYYPAQASAYIVRGEGRISNLHFAKFDQMNSQPHYLIENDGIANSTLISKSSDLSSILNVQNSNPRFYKTDFNLNPGPADFTGTNTYWSSFGGRVLFSSDSSRIHRWTFQTDDLTNLYSRFMLNGTINSKGYNYSVILNNNNASFYHSIDGQSISQQFLSNLAPNSHYTIEILNTTFGKALYFYKTSRGRGQLPSHILPLDLVAHRTYFQILRGKIFQLAEDEISGDEINSFPSDLAAFFQGLEDTTTLWKSKKSDDGRWVAYRTLSEMQAILDASYVKYFESEIPPRLLLKSDGSKYKQFTDGVVYNRNPLSAGDGIKQKGHHFEVSFDNSDLDPIFILAVEGKNPDGQYKRHAIVFRNNKVYAQVLKAQENAYSNWDLSGRDSHPNFKSFDLSGIFHVQIEPYYDGTAFYLWKEGETPPTDPIYIVHEAPFEQYNWKAFTYRNLVTLKIHPLYDLSTGPVLDSMQLSTPYKTWVSYYQSIFDINQMTTTLDNFQVFDHSNNTLLLNGNDQSLAVLFNYPTIIPRDKDFSITFEVSVDTVADQYSQFWAELYGSVDSSDDSVERTARYHYLEFWKNEVFARSTGPGISYQASAFTALNNLQANVFYQVEMKGTPQGTSIKISPPGNIATTPQSYFYAAGWDRRLRFRLRNGNAKLRNLVVSISDHASLEARAAQDLMSQGFESGELGTELDLHAPVSVLAHTALGTSGLDCWMQQGTSLQELDPQGQLLLKAHSDVRNFWESLVCSTAIERQTEKQVSIKFKTPEILTGGSQYLIGIDGFNKKIYRRHALFLTRTSATTMTAYSQVYSKKNGWEKFNQINGLQAGKEYSLVIKTHVDGSSLRLTEAFGAQNIILDHTIRAADFPGTLGAQDSEVADYIPHLTIQNRLDILIISDIKLE